MPRKARTPEKSFMEALLRIRRAGLSDLSASNLESGMEPPLEPLEARIGSIFQIFRSNVSPGTMVTFIMYDIENDRIRTQVAKYLERKGCIRVQKSIFLASLERKKWDEIHKTLREVQEMYKNYDSILLVPVSTDEIRSMKVIGHELNLELILGSRSTLFF